MKRLPRKGFESLAKLPKTSAPAGAQVRQPASKPHVVLPSSAQEALLWRQYLQGVVPLIDRQSAPLERPKPAPVVRAVQTEDHVAVPPAPQAGLAWQTGVTPLKDDHRAPLQPNRLSAQESATVAALAVPSAALLDALSANRSSESTLFAALMGGAQPLPETGRAALERPKPPARPRLREADERAALAEALAAGLSIEDRLSGGNEAAFVRDGVARRVLIDLRRGRWVVQGEIDLHGLTREEARLALAKFLAESLNKGLRCVRVIHGKGRGSPDKEGVLRHLSRAWLAQRKEILAFCQARPHEGGEGALRVLLQAKSA